MARLSDRRLRTLLALVAASAFCCALDLARAVHVGAGFRFLVWNLFLAWIPLGLALAVYDGQRRGRSPAGLAALSGLWLLFFPNAPYIVTDLFHLHRDLAAPLWFDTILFASFAWTGLLVGFVSLYLMQAAARRVVGGLASWALVLAALALGSFGIYLGRFERWNSWDLFTRPTQLLGGLWRNAGDPAAHPRTIAATVIFTGFLTLSYLVLYSFVGLARDERAPR
jgi:uncharacterized membrane protein